MFSVEENLFIGGKQCFQCREVQGSSVFSGWKQCFQWREVQKALFSVMEAVFSVKGGARKQCFQWREAVFSVERSFFCGGKQCFQCREVQLSLIHI